MATGQHEYYVSVKAERGARLVAQFGPFATMVQAGKFERDVLARHEMVHLVDVVWQRVEDVPLMAPCAVTGPLVPVTLAHGKVIPGYAVADFQVQSGLTRDQLRWGCDLALHWDMVSRKQLERWIDRVDVLGLSELMPHVGPADIEDEAEYRALMARP